ncbi:MAG: hypothetical protein BWY66_02946 [bacterium ADurb.Bin374]|nr:MAG: hypothetical protein BWY66_02946 [bacterium ADurb.Bin374]
MSPWARQPDAVARTAPRGTVSTARLRSEAPFSAAPSTPTDVTPTSSPASASRNACSAVVLPVPWPDPTKARLEYADDNARSFARSSVCDSRSMHLTTFPSPINMAFYFAVSPRFCMGGFQTRPYKCVERSSGAPESAPEPEGQWSFPALRFLPRSFRWVTSGSRAILRCDRPAMPSSFTSLSPRHTSHRQPGL